MGDSGGAQKTTIPTEIQTMKASLTRFHMEMRILFGIGLEAIHSTFWQRIYLHFVPVLRPCEGLNLKVTA
jgi:hypothetical protein